MVHSIWYHDDITLELPCRVSAAALLAFTFWLRLIGQAVVDYQTKETAIKVCRVILASLSSIDKWPQRTALLANT